MRAIICLLVALSSISATAQRSPVVVTNLTTEYKTDPVGIDTKHPRFSWKLNAPAQDVRQSGYEIKITSGKGSWTSGKQSSEESHLVGYQGSDLQAMTRYTWHVRVWDAKGNYSEWSKPAYFETGMMGSAWHAKWIEPEKNFSSKESLPPVMTKVILTHKNGAVLSLNNKPADASSYKREDNKIIMELGSGEYFFTTRR